MSFFFFSSRRRHTRLQGDWSSDVCSSDLEARGAPAGVAAGLGDHGGMAKGGRAAGSGAERNRQGVRKLSAFKAWGGQGAEEPGVLRRCGVGGGGGATGSGCGERSEEFKCGGSGSIFAGGNQNVLREKYGKAIAGGSKELRPASGDGSTVDGNCEVAGGQRYATGRAGEIGFGGFGEAADDP